MSQDHLSADKYLATVRAEIVRTARMLQAGEIGFLDGIRDLASLRHEIAPDGHDQAFMVFVIIDSESDHVPKSESRTLCSASWLDQCDNEIGELQALHTQDVNSACKQLIELFGRDA